MEIQKLVNDFSDWELHTNNSPTLIIKRIMLSLKPVVLINSILYVDYIGEEEKKSIFNEYFNKELINLESYCSVIYGATRVVNAKNLDKTKLEWLKVLINEYKPRHISFNILS